MNLFEAKEILKKNNYQLIKEEEETTDEVEPDVVVDVDPASIKNFTLFIQHTTGQEYDMRDKAQRRAFYMAGGRKRMGEATEPEEYGNMGSSRYKGFHRSDVQVNHSWTWVDTTELDTLLEEYGAKLVDEEHTKARVEHDSDEIPVADWGHDGPYGENSNYKTILSTTTSRYWYFKVSDPENSVDADVMEKLLASSMPAVVRVGVEDYDKFEVTQD